MNKLVKVAGVIAAGLIVGCVTTSDRDDPVGRWQKERFAADEILALQKQNKLPSAKDVAVRSSMKTKKFIDMIDAFDVPFAEIYASYVKSVDEIYANSEGRIVFQEVCDAMNDNKSTYEVEVAKLDPADKKLLEEYDAYVRGAKVDEALLSRLTKDAATALAGAAQVVDLVNKIKASPEYAALAGFTLVQESAALGSDAVALKDQISSISTAIQLRRDLIEQDKRAREYMIKR